MIFWCISTLLFSCGGAAGYNGPGEGGGRRRRGFLLFSFNLHFPQITFSQIYFLWDLGEFEDLTMFSYTPMWALNFNKLLLKKITVFVLFWIYVCNRNPILWAVCPNLPQKCRSAMMEPKSWILHSCCSSSFGLLMSGEFAFGGWSRALLVNV